jgi:hypothetical protein
LRDLKTLRGHDPVAEIPQPLEKAPRVVVQRPLAANMGAIDWTDDMNWRDGSTTLFSTRGMQRLHRPGQVFLHRNDQKLRTRNCVSGIQLDSTARACNLRAG